MGRRRSRRVKYYPVGVVQRILSNELLLAIASILLGESTPLPCGEIARRLAKIFGKPFTTGHISALLRKLEKWGVVRPYRSPYDGHLLWSIADTKTVELLVETIKKREVEQLMKTIGITP